MWRHLPYSNSVSYFLRHKWNTPHICRIKRLIFVSIHFIIMEETEHNNSTTIIQFPFVENNDQKTDVRTLASQLIIYQIGISRHICLLCILWLLLSNYCLQRQLCNHSLWFWLSWILIGIYRITFKSRHYDVTLYQHHDVTWKHVFAESFILWKIL